MSTPEKQPETIYTTSVFYRSVNDEILKLNQRFRTDEDTLHLVCECSDPRCAKPIEMTLHDYQELRSSAHYFAITSDHESSIDEHAHNVTGSYRLVTTSELVGICRHP